MRGYSIAAIVCVLTCLTLPAPAQQEEQGVIIRTYNVSDLMRVMTDYPLGSRVGLPAGAVTGPMMDFGGGGGFEGGQPRHPRKTLDPLSQILLEMVDTNSWAENGGDIGTIRTFDSLLVIRQTPENHERIEQLLAEIRKTAGPAQVVAVRAVWVLLPAGESPEPGAVVDTEWLTAQRIYCEARTVCFSGQTVHVTSGRARTVIRDLTPVVGESSAAYEPRPEAVQSGVALQVAPQLVPGTDRAILDLHSYATEWNQPGEPAELNLAVANTEARPSGTIDRVHVVAQQLKTTTRVPMGAMVVVGGMTFDPTSDDESGAQLCLVVEVNAVK